MLDSQTGVLGFGATNIAAFSGAKPLESFLAGVPSSETIKYGNPQRNIGWNQLALFAQDDWRILPRVTLNLGLRWEMQTPGRDANALLANFDPSTPTGMTQSNQLWKTQSEFSPHLGVVWDLTGQGRTVLRAGAGFAYETPQLQGFLGSTTDDFSAMPTGAVLYNANGSTIAPTGTINNVLVAQTPVAAGGVVTGVNAIPWAAGTDLFNTAAAIACGNGAAPVAPVVGAPAVNPSTCRAGGGNTNLKFAQVLTWSVTLQHAFTNNLSLSVGYVGTHSQDMMGYVDINEPTPGAAGSVEQSRRPYAAEFPWFATIAQIANLGSDNYNGLQVNLAERATKGLTFSANYTLSHALGNYPGAGSLVFSPNNLVPTAGYGNMKSDARHHLSISAGFCDSLTKGARTAASGVGT